jgi:hypothetical protein
MEVKNLWHSLGLFDDWFSTVNTVFNIWLIVSQIRSHTKIKKLKKENLQLKQTNTQLLLELAQLKKQKL